MSAKPRKCLPDAAQYFGAVVEQRLDRGVARRRDRRVAQRMVQRVAQKARAHRGDAGVEQAAQRRRWLAAQRFGQFQVAPGGRVEAQEGAVALDVSACTCGRARVWVACA
jgi:hypothetical protein